MEKHEVRAKIQEIGIVPAVRTSSAEDALFAAEVVAKGGIPIVEITISVPGAIDAISRLVKNLPDAIVSAGTLLDLNTARDNYNRALQRQLRHRDATMAMISSMSSTTSGHIKLST